MVWFQCESCGEELKKPKLPNHFRQCSAYKLSCIDCGVTFDKQTVQSHTQCISEAEKYGPKGLLGTTAATKPKQEKPKPDVDINVGLSNRPPWFCSLCNTKATSQQALLLHGDGKKHRAKVRAHTAKQHPPQEALPKTHVSAQDSAKTESLDDKITAHKENITSHGALGKDNSSAKIGNLSAKKKRKIDTHHDGLTNKCLNGLGEEISAQAGDQEKLKKLNEAKPEPAVTVAGSKVKKAESNESDDTKENAQEKIKWKKLITSVLKTAPDGALKMKKLRKLVFDSLQESGSAVDDMDLSSVLEHKVNSSSKFRVDGKYVRLAA